MKKRKRKKKRTTCLRKCINVTEREDTAVYGSDPFCLKMTPAGSKQVNELSSFKKEEVCVLSFNSFGGRGWSWCEPVWPNGKALGW